MSIKTFKRMEKKSLLTDRQYEELTKRMEPYMEYDQYCPDAVSYTHLDVYKRQPMYLPAGPSLLHTSKACPPPPRLPST